MTRRLPAAYVSLALALATAPVTAVFAQDQRFDITRFDVTGNTLLPSARITALLAPFTGKQRNFGDLQRALDALENAYRSEGYGAVQVELPEQEATSGVVLLNVLETRIAAVRVVDNKHYSQANVLRGLPSLQPGVSPNLRRLSENVQLSNENGAKQVEVSLAASESDGMVDARVRVTDRNPHQGGLSVDNTGTSATGKWRTGVFYQYANLFDRDHTVSLAYTTSPDSPAGVKIQNYSVGYRWPLYGWGDSIDAIFGKSSSNTPSSTPTLGGALDIVGKGDVFGLRLNHNLGREGESTRKLVLALDYKAIASRCATVKGVPVDTAPPTPPIASCVPYTVAPLSATYVLSTRSGVAQVDASAGLALNLPRGTRYTNLTGRSDRYSYLTSGNRDTRDHFVIVRGSASWMRGVPLPGGDWMVRLAASGQYALQPVLTSESMGLAGSSSVRGFDERAVSADSGVVANAELYGPEMAVSWPERWGASLRLLAFADTGHGWNHGAQTPVPGSVTAASIGAGMRLALAKSVTMRMDVARVLSAGHAPNTARGDIRAHVFLTLGY